MVVVIVVPGQALQSARIAARGVVGMIIVRKTGDAIEMRVNQARMIVIGMCAAPGVNMRERCDHEGQQQCQARG